MKCKKCNTEIEFLLTKNGKAIPINYETLTEIDLQEIKNGAKVNFRSKEHVSHFATCPFAEQFRKNRINK